MIKEQDRIVKFGKASFRNKFYDIQLKTADRLRHMYLIGKTGTGKSTLYQNMVLQDITSGAGCCFVDPHGEAIDWLLENIPENRLEDVVIFDPSDTQWPISLNLLEWKDEEEKDFLVAEAIQIFYKLFDPTKQGVVGPQFEHWMRNAALTVMSAPDGGTLIDIPRLFTDPAFELKMRKHIKDKVVLSFWEQQIANTAQFHKSEMLNYFTSKFGRFITNQTIRNIIGQKTSTLSMERIIDEKKILLINLSKGKIGETNSHMLGLILMTKLQAAVMKRASLPKEKRHPFFLFVDEFQNVMTDAFISMLSEARKYGLAVHLTNQYIAQLPNEMRDAILGNIGTLVAFQVGSQDVDVLLTEFEAVSTRKDSDKLSADDFQYIDKYNFYIRMMIDSITYPAFKGESLPPVVNKNSVPVEEVKAFNRLRYATPRQVIEK